ncbi:pyrroline-5-carboxylate reductase, partial [bacterium]|nr:pyrroline-5-carboxylate reductase [bacterium]
MLEGTLGFLGAGKMAEALARGILGKGLIEPDRILMSDVSAERRALVAETIGVQAIEQNTDLIEQSSILVLALKPNCVRDVLPDLAPLVTPEKLVVSIAAGITLWELEQILPDETRVVRVMPNTPCLVGEGAAGYSLGSVARAEDGKLVDELLLAVGTCFLLPERLLDAVTGLSGSGPAYVFLAIEAMADGGVRAGLPRDVALKLAAQTVLGAAKLALETGLHPADLKD